MRQASIQRTTKETDVSVALCLEGGEISVSTGIGFFDHMLTALAFYAGFGLELSALGDLHVDGHHTAEDVGIVLGQALREALGDKKGIRRYGMAFVPMDEALCRTVLDLSSRPYLVFDAPMPQSMIGGYDSCLTEEFMRALSVNGGITLHQKCEYGGLPLHQKCEYGDNAHHITEALFKSLGLALKEAVGIAGGDITSTKGAL